MQEQQFQTQNFIPSQKPNLWSRFISSTRGWFLRLNKIQKAVLIIAVLVLVALAVFVFARPTTEIDNFDKTPADDASARLYLDGTLSNVINDELYLGARYFVPIRLDSGEDDVVAVQAVLSYDPNIFTINIDSLNSVFEIEAEKSVNSNTGEIRIIVGTPGNGINNDGINPPTGNTGYNSSDENIPDGIVANLEIRPSSLTNGTASVIDFKSSSRVLRDDSDVSDILTSAQGYEWEVVEKPEFEAKLKFIQLPNAEIIFESDNNSRAIINWEININANCSLCYSNEQNRLSVENFTNNQGCSSPAQEGNNTYGIQHQVILENDDLTNGEKYFYAVRCKTIEEVSKTDNFLNKIIKNAKAQTQNIIFSPVLDFTVVEPISTDLEIHNLSVQPFYSSAVINWNTKGGPTTGVSDTRIDDCIDMDMHSSAGVYNNNYSGSLVHKIEIRGLDPNHRLYQCTIRSVARDENGEEMVGVEATDIATFELLKGKEPDANIVLKVERDRICDKWLYCRSSIEVENQSNQKENLCFDVGVCDELGPDGECALTVNFQKDLENVTTNVLLSEQNFNHPTSVREIENLSGLSKVGLNWSDEEKIPGYFHFGNMTPTEVSLNIPNSSFETGEKWPWFAVGSELVVDRDPYDKTNQVLIMSADDSNDTLIRAKVPLGWISTDNNYAISLGMRKTGADKVVGIELWIDDTKYLINNSADKVGKYWQSLILNSGQQGSFFNQSANDSGDGYLVLAIPRNDLVDDFIYIDNVSMKSVLPVSSDTSVARSCRMYPSASALSCDYTDSSGKQYQGWRGFCVEQDPKYKNSDSEKQMCLNWWPVDILPGETQIFGTDQQAGYVGRQPLYYCLESSGNYNRNDIFIQGCRADNQEYQTFCSPAIDSTSCSSNNSGPVNCEWKIYDPGQNGYKITYGGIFRAFWEPGPRVIQYFFPDSKLRKSEIENISLNNVKFNFLNERYNVNLPLYHSLGDVGFADYYWADDNSFVASFTEENIENFNIGSATSCENSGNFVGLVLFFNNEDELESVLIKECDDASSDGEGNTDSVSLDLSFYLKEPCNVLAQVVTPSGENSAWANRVKGSKKVSNWTKTQGNVLEYEYIQDYYPYGAAVVGEPVSDPSEWDDPLFVMPADVSMLNGSPYQIRAGTPYSVEVDMMCTNASKYGQICTEPSECNVSSGDYFGPCEEDTIGVCEVGHNSCTQQSSCTGFEDRCEFLSHCANNLTKECQDNDDCIAIEEVGVCQTTNSNIGATQCIAGSAERLGTQCDSASDCGYSLDQGESAMCVGVKLTEDQKKNIGGGWVAGQNRLSKLFAKSFEVWRWSFDGKKMSYLPVGSTTDIITGELFGWDITKDAPENDKPKITNIRINNVSSGSFNVQGPKRVVLKFNSDVNINHLPLTQYRVDWGDGKPDSVISNLRISDKNNYNDPHILFHTYDCVAGENCNFIPKIQIKDNWGWCNSSETSVGKCPENKDYWEHFNGQVVVLP